MTCVSQLRDKYLKWWKRDMVGRIFKPEEAEVITNIPLSPMLPEDKLV